MGGVKFLSLYAYDIETVPNDRAAAYFAAKTYQPDGRLTDPVKIQASIEEKRAKDAEKAGLYWWTGKVCCLSLQSLEQQDSGTFHGEDEAELLCQVFDLLKADDKLLGKSSEYFDSPFLVGRCLALDIGVPEFLRPYRPIQDIDHIFSFSSQCDQRSNLANYAHGLGIEGKNGHGSEVAGLYNEKKWDELRDYCRQDVAIVAEMYRRWKKPYQRREK
jgi:hypothetical protein